ncbi:4-carboxy-4-hydroxy-2-oxoadipate aldolase/oxaloacetate decarboxylase [Zophobihabitans entericus]|uniref:Putative 4-hydroxy-4-methyl-2-oxoglutarate aldolase n=1 Tax=Zophobihabitans entericus TaxID=1635327 RepID=A0A6G9IBP7_9GAMM|nr:4-carboxy-4-hydroxy-2-oxoadipate aldolase/oxaloacetate decarboxylase [Zophobihabitans entericus]QIQ21633.1 4-carboxy-4-hydroxy-2-oxoadipate aldolase/oxaloacetate decarboxylase [Zophobihabitans entericus]
MNNQIITQEMSAILKRLGSATIYEAQGAKGAFGSDIKPIDNNMRVVGRALTVDIRPADNLMLHYALLKARPGDVLVVDAKGFMEAGPWGDVLTEQAMTIGVEGLIINGAVRDANSISEVGFPVFCKGLSIKGTEKNQPGKLNVPVTISGVQINPGDIVVGDRDGLVVVSLDEVEQVIQKALQREAKEDIFKEKIRNGATTAELLNLSETLKRFELV